MASIVVAGDTSGAVTLEAPAIAGTTTLTLPTTSGTIVTTGGAASLTTSGNLTFTGTGNRITGDFNNATVASRVMFQTSTTNSNSILSVIPNGTATTSAFQAFNNSDPTNASQADLRVAGSTDVRLSSLVTGSGTALPMTFHTGGSERLRIDTSGRVLVGSTSARANLFNSTSTAPLQVEGTTADNSSVLAVRNTDTAAAGPFYILARARGTTVGSTTVVQSGDAVGTLSFQASDGTEFVETARIQSIVDGTPGANDMPGALAFSTTADGAATATERMRITSGGALLLGKTTATIGSAGQLEIDASYPQTVLRDPAATAGRTWRVGMGSGSDYIIYANGTTGQYMTWNATTWTASSDERLKTDLKPIENAVEKVKTLRTVTGRFKTDEENVSRVFLIAQDVQKVLPEAVDVKEDEDKTLGLRYTETIPLLVAAIKELNAKVEAQAAEIAALKGVK